jgi:peroxiredoxin
MKLIKNKSQAILYAITLFLIITNFLLILQNLQLRSEVAAAEPAGGAREGDILEQFQAKNLNGSETRIDYHDGNKKRVLLFFKTTCGYCKKQMKYWKELVSNADPQKFRITAVTTETNTQAISDYLKSYEVEDWEVLSIKLEDAQKARFFVTPITVVIDNKGTVEKVWFGMWQNSSIDSLSKYFGVNFSKS